MVVMSRLRFFNRNKLLLLYRNKDNNVLFTKFYRNSSTAISSETINFSQGSNLILSTGKYARFTNGCALATFGDTSVMVAAVTKVGATNNSFLPLVVHYRQKAAAAGRIPTNFLRRELGPTEQEILTSRLIDRSIRSLFPKEFSYETQITCNMLAIDGVNDPDIAAINGASAALSISDIPWDGPVGAVRIGMIDNELRVNPTRKDMQQSTLNLVVTATKQNLVVMLEGSANDIFEQDLKKAIKLGVKQCQLIVQSITKLQKACGKKKLEIVKPDSDKLQEVMESIKPRIESNLRDIFTNYSHDKISRDTEIFKVRSSLYETVKNTSPDINETIINDAFGEISKDIFRQLIFTNNIRCDGRKLDQLRDITCQVDIFKPLHGSAVFQRGQTQVLCTVTLDSLESALKMDSISMLISGVKEKNFFLHYEFPPYATNEIGRIGPAGRRELGHGALAEKGLRPVLPKYYPFTVRLTSEVLESNGSSSMASICGGSLALMDAGVPISAPVAGVAMGLVSKFTSDAKHIEDYKILTDISGIEDYLGDMDFKVAGTAKGFTALQVDIKIPGLPLKIVMEAIQQAINAKTEIINIMYSAIPGPRQGHDDKMPVVEDMEVPIHQRGKFLGVGGTNLKKIFFETGVHIYSKDETIYSLFAPNEAALSEAREMINKLIMKDSEPTLEFGGIYTAKIIEIRESGLMVRLYPTMTPTLLPNSQLDNRRIHHASVLGFEVGQEIQVKYFGRDPVNGQVRMSRKVLQEPTTVVKSFSTP